MSACGPPADGERFQIDAATDAIDPPSITLILNWKPAS
jgi:hypothetical protein